MIYLLNNISSTIAFLFLTGLIYCILDFTVGKITFLKSKFEWNGLQIKDFVFFVISLFIMIVFFHPYPTYH